MFLQLNKVRINVQEKKDAQPVKKLPKSLVAFFAAAQMLFGFNFGFVHITNTSHKTTVNIITIIAGCLMNSILCLSLPVGGWGQQYTIIYFVEYLATFFILMSARYTLCEYLTDLLEINKNTDHFKGERISLVVWCYTSLMFVVKMLTAIVYFSLIKTTNIHQLVLNSIFHIPMLALDIIPITNFILFYSMSKRMKELKIQLERRADTGEIQNAYKAVADGFEKFRAFQDGIVNIAEFLTESMKWMIMIWNHLLSVKSSNMWLSYACSCVWAVHITVQICAPAVCAELLTAHSEHMQGILHERLLWETDDAEKTEGYVRLLRYMKARPLVTKAWRLVPLDLRLPTTMLSMCITYLIVIIQFTHLYD